MSSALAITTFVGKDQILHAGMRGFCGDSPEAVRKELARCDTRAPRLKASFRPRSIRSASRATAVCGLAELLMSKPNRSRSGKRFLAQLPAPYCTVTYSPTCRPISCTPEPPRPCSIAALIDGVSYATLRRATRWLGRGGTRCHQTLEHPDRRPPRWTKSEHPDFHVGPRLERDAVPHVPPNWLHFAPNLKKLRITLTGSPIATTASPSARPVVPDFMSRPASLAHPRL